MLRELNEKVSCDSLASVHKAKPISGREDSVNSTSARWRTLTQPSEVTTIQLNASDTQWESLMGFSRVSSQSKTSFRQKAVRKFYFSKLTDLESAFWTCSNSSVCSRTQTGSLMGFSRARSQSKTSFRRKAVRNSTSASWRTLNQSSEAAKICLNASDSQWGSLKGFSRVGLQCKSSFRQGRFNKFHLSMVTDLESVFWSCKD